MSQSTKNVEITDDAWVHTSCGGCYATCTVNAHRVNGVIVKIEGVSKDVCSANNDFLRKLC